MLIAGNKLLPIEVKAKLNKPRIPIGLRSFINTYHPQEAVVVSEEFSGEIK